MAVLSAGESLLSGHARQSEDPVESLYVPVAQGEHVPPSGPEYPTLHTQPVGASLALGELLLEAQSLHAALPVFALYSPSTQAVQAPPSGPV